MSALIALLVLCAITAGLRVVLAVEWRAPGVVVVHRQLTAKDIDDKLDIVDDDLAAEGHMLRMLRVQQAQAQGIPRQPLKVMRG